MTEFGRIAVTGDPAARRALARAMIGQLAAFHSPDDVRIAVCASPAAIGGWEWLKWLPHAMSEDRFDAIGQVRLRSENLIGIEAFLGATQRPGVDGPHLVVVLDGGRVAPEARLAAPVQGVTVLDLGAVLGTDSTGVLRLELGDGSLTRVHRETGGEQRSIVGVADALSTVEAETLARQMAPLRMSAHAAADALNADLDLPELLGLGDPCQLDPDVTWRTRAPRGRLRVPIGVGAQGEPVELDLKESALGGMGPHGLVIGATGSGKSELLRTLVLGLALTHSSETLNLVLVDFKGGATFASLDALSHTSAVITNLSDELTLVDRMRAALHGELVRRQEALRAAGNHPSQRDYERAREQGAPLAPMPSLLIVVDEFSELLAARPDFIELFVMIGRLGRSLGVHLLLAAQRLEEGRLRGLDTQLSYRVGLRTFSSTESRVVLGTPDAYELLSAPGNGYLKDGTEGLVRFRAAYVSGSYIPATNVAPEAGHVGSARVLPYQSAYLAPKADGGQLESGPEPDADEPAGTLMDVLIDRLAGAGTPARAIWLPPLSVPPTLDELLPPLRQTERGLRPGEWDDVAPLTVPIGLVDRPFEQRRDPHWVSLPSAHFVVVGRPQSGKSTVLRSLITSLSITHSPEQVQFYCLDFGGGTLTSLADLPHVGSVATRLESDRLRRTIADVEGLLARREQLFTAKRIDSMATYRRMLASGQLPSDGYGDVFLVVDGWGTMRADHEELETAVSRIAARGLGFGVHVLLSVQRWMELRPALKDLISARLELRLGDPSESDVDRRVAANVPEGAPGRGLIAAKLHFLAALPRIDGKPTAEDLSEGVSALVTQVDDGWNGPAAAPVRLLPARLPYSRLPSPDPSRAAVPIGRDESLAPVCVDFDAEPHFVTIGDVESGKSNLLRTVLRGIITRWSADQAKIITLDYRRGLLGAVTTAHLIGSALSSATAPDVVRDIAAALRGRLSGIEVNPARGEVRRWRGPRLFVVIDDYDLVAAGAANPMSQILEFLPHARDIGLHVVLSRSAGGAGQGMYEPVLRGLREMATPGILLSGSRDVGAVLGSVKMDTLPTGRGRLVHRRLGSVLIQTALDSG